MKVTSEKKAAAARANGALSRGPITPEGKARSSQNALQHGLFSTSVVLATEDPEAFSALLQDYCDYTSPPAASSTTSSTRSLPASGA
jgi:hypothetical protein